MYVITASTIPRHSSEGTSDFSFHVYIYHATQAFHACTVCPLPPPPLPPSPLPRLVTRVRHHTYVRTHIRTYEHTNLLFLFPWYIYNVCFFFVRQALKAKELALAEAVAASPRQKRGPRWSSPGERRITLRAAVNLVYPPARYHIYNVCHLPSMVD